MSELKNIPIIEGEIEDVLCPDERFLYVGFYKVHCDSERWTTTQALDTKEEAAHRLLEGDPVEHEGLCACAYPKAFIVKVKVPRELL